MNKQTAHYHLPVCLNSMNYTECSCRCFGSMGIFLRLVRHRFHLRSPAGLHLGRRPGLTGGSRRRRSAGTVTGIRDLSPSDL